jgi:uncharacterized protein YecE (DUF72 family)
MLEEAKSTTDLINRKPGPRSAHGDVLQVGTCGFRSTKSEYARHLSCVEIQQTFYQPPMIKTLERWRSDMPDDFEFTLKAWQLITHESRSPTYKRLRRKLTEREANDSGGFRSTPIVTEAWETTLQCAKALRSRTVLFQCPASYGPTKPNLKVFEKFFQKADRAGLNFCWEPRGPAWTDEIVKSLCRDLDLWHVVDPFARATVTPEKCYFRLHGRVRWRYTYEDDELEELAGMIPADRLAYVFFNNITMIEDATRFRQILKMLRQK